MEGKSWWRGMDYRYCRESRPTDSLVPLGRWMGGSQAQGQEERQDWKSSVLRLREPVQGGHSS